MTETVNKLIRIRRVAYTDTNVALPRGAVAGAASFVAGPREKKRQ